MGWMRFGSIIEASGTSQSGYRILSKDWYSPSTVYALYFAHAVPLEVHCFVSAYLLTGGTLLCNVHVQ